MAAVFVGAEEDAGLQFLGLRASSSAVAEISSDAPAFCCVTLSSCWIAVLIWARRCPVRGRPR
jgi:hypothetical protein